MLLFEIVTIGNELLSGDVVDTNASFLGTWITRLGHRVHRRQTVPDEISAIIDALSLAVTRSQWIVVSGGLGPTNDDLTAEAVAKLVDEPMRCDPRSLQRIQDRFAQRGIAFPENNIKQAYFPNSATIIDNPIGTAPAFEMRIHNCRLTFLPGVHREFRAMVEQHVIPALTSGGQGQCLLETMRLFGATESEIGAKLATIELRPGELIQYRVKFPEVLVTPVVQHGNPERLQVLVDEIEARVGNVLYARGETTLAEVTGQRLRAKNWTIAVAESCTGGMLGELLTAIPGASDYVASGVIVYSNAAKQALLGVNCATLTTYGAVSEPTVEEMLSGIIRISQADVGVAISGIAGPGGGTEDKPVGTVYIGVKTPDCPPRVFRRRFPGNREWVRTLSAWTAMDLVCKILKGVDPESAQAPTISR